MMKNRWDEENLKFHIKNSKNKSEVLKKIINQLIKYY